MSAHPSSCLPLRRDLWPIVRQMVSNAWRMTLLWVLFGILVGILTTPAPRGAIGLVAYAIAGIIVLSPLGAIVGLLGARRSDAVIMAGLGTLAGALVGVGLRQPDLGYTSAVGLIIGILVGTTFVTLFYRLPRLVIGAITLRA